MASFENAIRQELEKTVTNVFPLFAPEGTPTPYCVYVSSYGERDLALEGYLASREIEVTVHIVAQTYEQMKTLTNGVMDNFCTFTNKKIGTDLLRIQAVKYDDPTEMVEPETKVAHSFVDFNFRL